MAQLKNKVVIITGAARGMGEATARLFASQGAKLALGDVMEDVGQTVAADLGKECFFRKLDVSSDDNWAQFVKATVETCLLYTSPSPRDRTRSRMPSSA